MPSIGRALSAQPAATCVARPGGRIWRVVLAIIAAGSLLPAVAAAQATPLVDHFTVGVGSYHAVSSTTIGAKLPHGFFSGSVNLEHDLGFDSNGTVPRIRGSMLVGTHQGLSLDYYRYSRASTRTWDRSLDWDGTPYHAHARLHGRVSFAFGSLAWRWWFGNGDDDAVALGAGASHYRASGMLTGKLTVNAENRRDVDEDTGASAWAPLVQFGWRHAFGAHWRAYLDAAGVFKGGGYLSGHIYNASLGLEWMPGERLGFALEYGINSIHIKQSRRYYTDSLDLDLHGPSAFVYLRF